MNRQEGLLTWVYILLCVFSIATWMLIDKSTNEIKSKLDQIQTTIEMKK